ncbi:unnamed protein product [Notodromas monacha]|uniref:Uncharacterized protein n=1 Tax=Notodromas monacha TaxID=399045 RepID=A0A7R9GID9_9CRUS|nr:unnamed protein product [Notodromas monacha]CAG0923757.1 unnamed protein product [Notodromas monacha]
MGRKRVDFFRETVGELLPDLRKSLAYWKAQAFALRAENERLQAALHAVISGVPFENVYEAKFAPISAFDSDEIPDDVNEEEDEEPENILFNKDDLSAIEEDREETLNSNFVEVSEDQNPSFVDKMSAARATIENGGIDEEFLKFIRITREHQKRVEREKNECEIVLEEEIFDELENLTIAEEPEPLEETIPGENGCSLLGNPEQRQFNIGSVLNGEVIGEIKVNADS